MTLSAPVRSAAVVLLVLVLIVVIALGVATVSWRRATARKYQSLSQPVPVSGTTAQPQDRFERREGFLVPGSAEVAWLLPEGRFTYWRGRPLGIEYK